MLYFYTDSKLEPASVALSNINVNIVTGSKSRPAVLYTCGRSIESK